MPDVTVRPSKKCIRFLYWTIFILICLAFFTYNNYYPDASKWPLTALFALMLWPAVLHLRQHFTKIAISGDKLRYESGVLSKTTRTLQLAKVQDVRVDQSLWQRIIRVGTLSIETAGESSRLTIANIDEPQAVADQILDAAPDKPSGTSR